jgi:hypothetical protein
MNCYACIVLELGFVWNQLTKKLVMLMAFVDKNIATFVSRPKLPFPFSRNIWFFLSQTWLWRGIFVSVNYFPNAMFNKMNFELLGVVFIIPINSHFIFISMDWPLRFHLWRALNYQKLLKSSFLCFKKTPKCDNCNH